MNPDLFFSAPLLLNMQNNSVYTRKIDAKRLKSLQRYTDHMTQAARHSTNGAKRINFKTSIKLILAVKTTQNRVT